MEDYQASEEKASQGRSFCHLWRFLSQVEPEKDEGEIHHDKAGASDKAVLLAANPIKQRVVTS